MLSSFVELSDPIGNAKAARRRTQNRIAQRRHRQCIQQNTSLETQTQGQPGPQTIREGADKEHTPLGDEMQCSTHIVPNHIENFESVIPSRDFVGCEDTHVLDSFSIGYVPGLTDEPFDATQDIFLLDSKGNTPLHEAVIHGRQSIVQILVGRGADVKVPNALGKTPLHIAAELGKRDLIQALAPSKESMDIRDCSGMTPLHLAVRAGHDCVVTLLLDRGAQVDSKVGMQA